MTVVVDIGNTRVKWARAGHGALSHFGAADLLPNLDEAFAPLAAALSGRRGRIVACNVAGVPARTKLTELARGRGVDPTFVEPLNEQFGVRCAYADPTRLGADRWVGVIAAHRLVGGAACVVDAGTTITLDVVRAGEHLGGLIMPGPAVAAVALGRTTRGIGPTSPAESAVSGHKLLGASTGAAVAHGTMIAIAAGIDRAVAEVTAALGEPLTVVLTGGGAEVLEPWLETAVSYRPHFILEGLAEIAAATVCETCS